MDNSNDLRASQLLNEYQLRRVKIILTLFEEDLNFALRWLDGDLERGSLFLRELVLSEDLRKEARQTLLEGLDEIHILAQTLDFRPEVENVSKSIMGRFNTDWENLSDLRSSNLKGFGKVHPELSDFLDPRANRLSEIASKLGEIFMKGAAATEAGPNQFNKQEKEP